MGDLPKLQSLKNLVKVTIFKKYGNGKQIYKILFHYGGKQTMVLDCQAMRWLTTVALTSLFLSTALLTLLKHKLFPYNLNKKFRKLPFRHERAFSLTDNGVCDKIMNAAYCKILCFLDSILYLFWVALFLNLNNDIVELFRP